MPVLQDGYSLSSLSYICNSIAICSVISMQTQWYCAVISMVLRSNLNGIAMQYLWYCDAISMLLRCNLNAFAMQSQCFYDVISMLLRCNLNAFAMQYNSMNWGFSV